MRRLPGLICALTVLAACSGEDAATPTAGDVAFLDQWFATADGTQTVNIHATEYGLSGRVRTADGSMHPIRNIVMSDDALSFVVPAMEASWSGTQTAEGWSGAWTQGGEAKPLVLVAGAEPSIATNAGEPESRFVTLADGRQMHMRCAGAGSPAVLFDSGAGGGARSWAGVLEAVGTMTLACAYDRAGRELSDPGPLPRDAEAVASDIEAMMAAAGISSPYVLAGHSLGSYHVRQFANTRFDKVAGVVLVDPSGDGQKARFFEAMPAAFAALQAQQDAQTALGCVEQMRARLVPRSDPLTAACFGNDADMIEAGQSEIAAMDATSAEQLGASRRAYGEMPLIVLTRGDYEKEMPPEFSADDRKAMERVWKTMHEEMAALSRVGSHRIVAGTGHYIQRDDQQAVIDAVKDVVEAARACAG